MKQFHDFDIVVPGPTGKDVELSIDGIRLVGVRRFELIVDVNDANKITIEMVAGSINVRVAE